MSQIILVADTETTGVVDPIHIVEVAWSEIDEDLSVVSEFCSLVNPGVPVPCDASALSGVRTEDLVDAPTIDQIPFPKDEVILICHNVSYDRPLLAPHMNIVGEICTMVLARRILKSAPSYALGALSCYCNLPRYIQHRAEGDVRTALALLDYMMEAEQMNLQQMYDYYNSPVLAEVMPFGKHKGTPVQDVPIGYIKWLVGSGGTLDKDLDFTLRHYFPQLMR